MIKSISTAEFYIQRRWQLLYHRLLAIAQMVWVQRLVIITAVLLISIALPLVLSRTRLLLVIGMVLAVTAVLIFLYKPPLGLFLLVGVSLVLPSPDLPGGLNLTVLFLLLLIALWFLEMFIVQRNIWVVRSRPVKPLLALLLVVIISLFFGQLPWFRHAQPAPLETQIGGLLIFICAVGAFLLVAQQIRELFWLQWMTYVYIAMSAFFVAGWVVPGVGPISSRLFHIGAISNSLFWTWLVALAFGQAVFNDKLKPFWRLVLLGVTAMTLFVGFVLNSEWKSGYLPPIAAVAVILALRSWRLGLLMVLIAPIAAYFLTSQAIATDDYSYGTRVDAWIIMFEIIKVNPLLGLGPANYYWYTPLFPIRGWAVSFNSHNQYVDIIAQAGLLGMLCVIWFAIEQGLLGWRLKDRVPSGFARAYVYCVLGGLVGTLVGGLLADWFFPFVYNIGYYGFRGAIPAWLFLGGLVSLEQMYANNTGEVVGSLQTGTHASLT